MYFYIFLPGSPLFKKRSVTLRHHLKMRACPIDMIDNYYVEGAKSSITHDASLSFAPHSIPPHLGQQLYMVHSAVREERH
jgi:hypothetical protein